MKKITAITLALCLTVAFALSAFAAGSDVDGDGEVTAQDARAALRCAIGLEDLIDDQFDAADFDGDGEVTAQDARSILREALGMESDKDVAKILSDWMIANAENVGGGKYYYSFALDDFGTLEMMYYNGELEETPDGAYFDFSFVGGREIRGTVVFDSQMKAPVATIINGEDEYTATYGIQPTLVCSGDTTGLTLSSSEDLNDSESAREEAMRVASDYIIEAMSYLQRFCDDSGLSVDVRSDLGFTDIHRVVSISEWEAEN